MNTLVKIYWLRVILGAVAGLLSATISVVAQMVSPGTSLISVISSTNTLLNGITIALLTYLISFYVLKAKFSDKVEKKSKIMTMGIFIYFFAWLVAWVLTLSIIIGSSTA